MNLKNLNRDYRQKYELLPRAWGNIMHVWSVETALGAVHLHITDYGEDRSQHFVDRYSGGVEYHWRYPPAHAPHKAPDHTDCPYVHGVCWHDGTSMYASDYYVPMIENAGSIDSVHEMIFLSLERDVENQLHPSES